MEAFVISDKEKEFFLPSIPLEAISDANLFVGSVDSDGTACGTAVFHVEAKNIRLLYIFVAEDYRRKGAGSEMMDLVAGIAKQKGFSGIEASFFPDEDTNGIYAFLRSLGYMPDDDPQPAETLTTLKHLSEQAPKSSNTNDELFFSLANVSGSRFALAAEYLKNNVGEDEYIAPLPKSCYSQDLSFLAFVNREPVGGILIRELDENEMEVSYIWMNKKSTRLLSDLIAKAVTAALGILPPETPVRMIGYTGDGERLIRRLSRGAATERTPVRLMYSLP